MTPSRRKEFAEFFPVCRSLVPPDTWDRICDGSADSLTAKAFPDYLASLANEFHLPEFIPELARLEEKRTRAAAAEIGPQEVERLSVNPTLRLFSASWKNLPAFFPSPGAVKGAAAEPGEELLFIWRDPSTSQAAVEAASVEDLLAVKLIQEGVDPREASRLGKIPIGAVDGLLDRAARKGILIRPPSRLRRDPAFFPAEMKGKEEYLASSVFTLQWHITQACDLSCKHCYDRSGRAALALDKGLAVIEDLRNFCHDRQVKGQVSFTGGNPFLSPHFYTLYKAAAESGLETAVLGNPVSREQVLKLIGIRRPAFFQVSLEGLPEHNDSIREGGHFRRVLEFLALLRELGIYSMVMLTLTRENMDQVLPLAETLRGRADSFTFNRLSQVGEGARLSLPSPLDYASFLESFHEAGKTNPIIALKDNLINIIRRRRGWDLFGGCTGFGCGAAFNFLALLPDGEVHACRKFPSWIGNIQEMPLAEIYDSERAQAYRTGSAACSRCRIRPVCGGCLAVVHGCGLDVFKDRDPFCFLDALPLPVSPGTGLS